MSESLPAQLTHRDLERLRAYLEAIDFYSGNQWPGRPQRGEKRLAFNYAKVSIDKLTSYLMSGMSFAVDAVEDTAEARALARRARRLQPQRRAGRQRCRQLGGGSGAAGPGRC